MTRRGRRAGEPRVCGTAIPHCDAGSASIWVVALAGVLLAAAMVVAAFARVVMVGHQARTAADLAALAAAARPGALDACAASAAAAVANSARLVDCRPDPTATTYEVVVEVQPASFLGRVLPPVRVTARAGPPIEDMPTGGWG